HDQILGIDFGLTVSVKVGNAEVNRITLAYPDGAPDLRPPLFCEIAIVGNNIMLLVEDSVNKYLSTIVVSQIGNSSLPLDVEIGFYAFLDGSVPAVQYINHIRHTV